MSWFHFKNSNDDRHFRDILKSGFSNDNLGVMAIRASLLDFNTYSKVQVNVGELAVFIQNGHIVQTFEPNTTPFETKNYPFFSNFMAILQGGVRSNACSMYFIRTTPPKTNLRWGTNNMMDVRDPEYNNTIAHMGGCGEYAVSVEITQLEKFFTKCVGGDVEYLSYDQLSGMIAPVISNQYLIHLQDVINRFHYADGQTPPIMTQEMAPCIKDFLLENYGLTVTMFNVSKVNIQSSPERKALKEACNNVNVNVVNAKGKLAEIEALGAEEWKNIKTIDLLEKSFAQQSTFLNTGSQNVGQILANEYVNTQLKSSSAPQAEDSNHSRTNTKDESAARKEIVMKQMNELFIAGKISQEYYMQIINHLNENK